MKPKIKEGINDKEIDGGRKMSEKTESRTTYTYKEWQAKDNAQLLVQKYYHFCLACVFYLQSYVYIIFSLPLEQVMYTDDEINGRLSVVLLIMFHCVHFIYIVHVCR